MEVLQQYTTILQKERLKELVPFLKSLEASQKKELTAKLKGLEKEYLEYGPLPNNKSQYGQKATPAQVEILGLTFFTCYNKKDFEKARHTNIIEKTKLDQILPWYCPVWFSDYINDLARSGFVPFYMSYEWYMELVQDGFVDQTEEMIARLLPGSIFTRHKQKNDFIPRVLLDKKVSLDEHIWYLFYHENTVHWSDSMNWVDTEVGEGHWKKAFKLYLNENRIDRSRLLKECLLGANRNFPQNLSGWFIDLFVYLAPVKEEIKSLQNELLPLLGSPFSKPLNTALKYLKELAVEPEFALDAFLDNSSAILTSPTKPAINSVLITFDKIAKKYPDYREQVCVLSCQAFIQQDNAIQLRAAKLISKYAEKDSEIVSGEIFSYWDALFFEAKSLLTDFRAAYTEAEYPVVEEETIHEETAGRSLSNFESINLPETFDEVVFLASQAFDQNETYHFDLLPAALLRFQNDMTRENIERLEPAFQRAYKIITSDWISTVGYLDNMLATFFISFGQLLTKLYPDRATSLKLMHKAFNDKEEQKKVAWKGHNNPICTIGVWDIYSKSQVYKPYKSVLVQAMLILENKVNLPLLSTPTHKPCWIDSVTLVERLRSYQDAKVRPDEFDFQIAVNRCFIDNSDDFKTHVSKILEGELQSILLTLAGEEAAFPEKSELKSVWLMAAVKAGKLSYKSLSDMSSLSESFFSGKFEWSSTIEPYMRQEYNYKQQKYVNVPDTRKVIRINFNEKTQKASILQNMFKFLPSKKEEVKCLYDFIDLKYEYLSAEHNDIKRLLYYYPRNTEVHVARIIAKCLGSPDLSGENVKKLLINTFEALLTLRQPFGPMGHLLIATCMICSDKVVRNYASELWITGVTENTIDSKLIGEIIGKHEQVEIAPIKRFTDLVIGCMFQVSPRHNAALKELLTSVIEALPPKPINNLKKLLEVFTEVVSISRNQPLSVALLEKLTPWKTTDSLIKTIDKLEKVRAR